MRKTVFCRRLPAARLQALRAAFARLAVWESGLADIRQLSSGLLLLDWENGARHLVSPRPAAGGAYAEECVGLRVPGGTAPGGRALPGLDARLFSLVSGFFEKHGEPGVAALDQKDLAAVPGAAFRSFFTAPALSGRPRSVSFDLAECAALQIGDEECWFDIANHIEPFCLSYAVPACDTFDPFSAPRAGARSSAFRSRLEKSAFFPMRDKDMLTGWDGLREAAACAGAAAGRRGAVVVDSGCLAQACGVNSSDIADGLRCGGARPVRLTTPVSRAEQPALRPGGRGAAAAGSVDFFNAEGEVFQAELAAACKGLKLTVNSFCFPGYSADKLASYGAARTGVVFFSGRNSGAVRGILGERKAGPLLCDACFGPAQMARFLKELAAAAGGRGKTAGLAETLAPGASARLAAVRRKFKGLRAAVVLDADEVHLAAANWAPGLRRAVLDEGFYRGAELEDAPLESSSRLKALCEDAGLGLDFFILAARGSLPGARRGAAALLGAAFPGSTAAVFGSEADLYAALGRSGARGVFSVYCYDDRVLACGKVPLPLDCVGAGVQGALKGYEVLARKLTAGLFKNKP